MPDRCVCIHGHFYQPPRQDPWLGTIPAEDSARPWHDWNELVTAACYAPNTDSRVLDGEGKIADIVNNFSRISFNIGPTLFSWLEKRRSKVYQAILEADIESMERFGGHGAAIAQCYGHMIMPLASAHDMRTQVRWGIADFRARFKRMPEGMWLPELAVDTPTLETLAAEGIRFTVLSPHQAAGIRHIHEEKWQVPAPESFDVRIPYRCPLPSGASIDIFFYDAGISQEIAFGEMLRDGGRFAAALTGRLEDETDRPLLVSVANDGETYGHHRRFGDMALAYCLGRIEQSDIARLTVFGEFLEKHPPEMEATIREQTSWSCPHGIERWRSGCSCSSGCHPDWDRSWRKGLREAMDLIRPQLDLLFEQKMPLSPGDPWTVRDLYIGTILAREQGNGREGTSGEVSPEDMTARILLEMQRHAMLMYTSCGWFFDDIAGIEAAIVLRHACRAMQLARLAGGPDLEEEFVRILATAQSSRPGFTDGADVYRRCVLPFRIGLEDAAARYAVFCSHGLEMPAWWAETFHIGPGTLTGFGTGVCSGIAGTVKVTEILTGHSASFDIAAYSGRSSVISGAREAAGPAAFRRLLSRLNEDGEDDAVLSVMTEMFGKTLCRRADLSEDDRLSLSEAVLGPVLSRAAEDMEMLCSRYGQEVGELQQSGRAMPPPVALAAGDRINRKALEFIRSNPDAAGAEELLVTFAAWNTAPDHRALSSAASTQAASLLDEIAAGPLDPAPVTRLAGLLEAAGTLSLETATRENQDRCFEIAGEQYRQAVAKTREGDENAAAWAGAFEKAAGMLGIGLRRDDGQGGDVR